MRRLIAVVGCLAALTQAKAQTVDQTPTVSTNQGFPRHVYRPGSVSNVNPQDSPRAASLIRAVSREAGKNN